MKSYFTSLFILSITFLNAQSVVDFEEFALPAETFLNGDDGSGGFTSGNIFLPNDYNLNYSSWSGWIISNSTDVTTPGYTNQQSAIAGSGYNGSETYAVTYAYGNNNMILQGDAAGTAIPGMYVTNNTYAYLSMLEGDAYAKKFGGLTGDDPDFFLLTIRAYSAGILSTDSVNFYLADFRSADNSQDYIVNEWSWVDLSSLGAVDSLSFALTSSDVGQFGMNTPAYFCLDNVFADDPLVSSALISAIDLMHIYPNPTADFIQIRHSENNAMGCSIFDTAGRLIKQKVITQNNERISMQHLPSGTYYVRLELEGAFSTTKVLKH